VDEVQSTLELGYMLASASQAWPNGRRFKLTPRCCRAALLRDVHFARDPKSGFPDTELTIHGPNPSTRLVNLGLGSATKSVIARHPRGIARGTPNRQITGH